MLLVFSAKSLPQAHTSFDVFQPYQMSKASMALTVNCFWVFLTSLTFQTFLGVQTRPSCDYWWLCTDNQTRIEPARMDCMS